MGLLSSYVGGRNNKMTVHTSGRKTGDPIQKITNAKRARCVAQAIGCLETKRP
jgi:hypothetical protein